MAREKLFSIPDSDLKWETFRAGGAGGQNVNKRDSAARVTHIPSGISHEAREQRQQLQNKRSALAKLAKDPKFVLWCKMHLAANKEGFESLERKLDEAMEERNLSVETGAGACVPDEAHCDKT